MALKLPKGMDEHYGRNVDKMPELLKSGRVPMSVSGIMQTRLRQGNKFPNLWNNYFDTSDLVIYPKRNNKDIYILLTVDNQEKITKKGKKALELITNNYTSNNGSTIEQGLIKVPRNKVTTETYLTKDQVLNEQIWRILARHPDEVPAGFAKDKKLLGKYFDEVASRTNSLKNMTLYPRNSSEDKTILRMWCIYGIENMSTASGKEPMVSNFGRLIGDTKVSKLEKSVMDALSQKKSFEYKGTLYVPVQDKKEKINSHHFSLSSLN